MAKSDPLSKLPVYVVTAIFLDEEEAKAAARSINGTMQEGRLSLVE